MGKKKQTAPKAEGNTATTPSEKISDKELFKARSQELFKPIEQQILMCDDNDDFVILAVTMLNSATLILKNHAGPEGAKVILEDKIKELDA